LVDLSVKIGKITFPNPIFVASGTFGYGTEVSDSINVSELGAIVSKSITLFPREGNPPPRLVETSSGMLNSIGLANVGVERFITDLLPEMDKIGAPIIINVAGTDKEEYIKVINKIESVSSNIVGYEINVSCPNVKKGGMEFGVDPSMTEDLTRVLRKCTDRLLIMKLSPNVTDIASIGKAAEEGGADALSAINTVVGMSIDPVSRKSRIYTYYGGLSGPAIKPVGIAAVHKIYQKVKIPIIGIGGITSAGDVAEYFLAGATAVQVGTANFRNPGIGLALIKDFAQYCQLQNVARSGDLTGSMKKFDTTL